MNDLFWQKLKAEKQFNVIEFPYALFLNELDSVRVKQPLRFIPQKRLVVLADWQEKKVIVKFFISSSAKRHYQREKNNILQLQQIKIDTPAILIAGQIPNQNIYFLVLEYLEDATSLAGEFEKHQLLPQTCRILAKLHEHHFLHHDVHLDNFLVQKQKIYLIDFACVKKNILGLPLSFAQKIKNLALFAAQFEENTALHKKILLEYLLASDQQITPQINKLFQHYLNDWQEKREQKYLKKVFRNSSAFYAEKKWNYYFVCRRYYVSALAHFFADPKQYLQEKKSVLFKDGNSSTVLKFNVEQFPIVVKRYNIKDFMHGLKRAFRTSRAHKSWYYSHLLMMNGIHVPQPIAFYEQRFFMIKSTSYFLMEEISGEPLLHYFLNDQHSLEEKKQIITEMKALFAKLAQLNIAHGDTKAMNYLVHNHKVFLIDLDGMQQFRDQAKFKKALIADQQRFLKDWQRYPELWPLFRNFFSVEVN